MAEISRAVISVYDKEGVVAFARRLSERGVEILSTGGTARALREGGVEVTLIEDYTGFPEMMDGRVKTLNPRIHGGILARRDKPEDGAALRENGIEPIDMVVVNLYPFERTVAREGVSLEEVMENIDIGGPTMLRAAAKNYRFVTVITDPADYGPVIEEIEETGKVSEETNARLAVKVFARTADYDAAIDVYLSGRLLDEKKVRLRYGDGLALRYGENRHQGAVFYKDPAVTEPCIANAEQLHGKELSYNNIVDAEASLEAAKELAPACGASVIKHTNPCGYATGRSMAEALAAAWEGDVVSAFGSVITCTREVDLETARVLEGKFVEILLAPDFTPDALAFLKQKSRDIRLLRVPGLSAGAERVGRVWRSVVGGLLEQDRDDVLFEKWETVTRAGFPGERRGLAEFACKACKWTKSNAIVLAREYGSGCYHVAGMGAGQPNRVDSLRKLAVTKAEENLRRIYRAEPREEPEEEFVRREFGRMVMASDAFFPFPDTVDAAAEHGIRFIVQPGGSKRDAEVVAAADAHGIAMVFTGTRHFLH